MFKLTGVYKHTFQAIKRQIIKKTKNTKKRHDVLNDLESMFIDLEMHQRPLDDFNQTGAYAEQLIESLEPIKIRHKYKYFFAAVILMVTFASTMIWLKLESTKYRALMVPQVFITIETNTINWTPVEDADTYILYIDNVKVAETSDTFYQLENPDYFDTLIAVVEATSENKYIMPSKSVPTYLTTKDKESVTFSVFDGSVFVPIDDQGNGFVKGGVDFTGTYVINVLSDYAIEVSNLSIDENVTVYTVEDQYIVQLDKDHYYEFKITKSGDHFTYFSIDAYQVETNLDQMTFDIPANSGIIIKYEKPLGISHYYRLVEDNPFVTLETRPNLSDQVIDTFMFNPDSILRIYKSISKTYIVITNSSNAPQTISLENITADIIQANEDTIYTLEDTDKTQILEYYLIGKTTITMTFGERDLWANLYTRTGQSVDAVYQTIDGQLIFTIQASEANMEIFIVISTSPFEHHQSGPNLIEIKLVS